VKHRYAAALPIGPSAAIRHSSGLVAGPRVEAPWPEHCRREDGCRSRTGAGGQSSSSPASRMVLAARTHRRARCCAPMSRHLQSPARLSAGSTCWDAYGQQQIMPAHRRTPTEPAQITTGQMDQGMRTSLVFTSRSTMGERITVTDSQPVSGQGLARLQSTDQRDDFRVRPAPGRSRTGHSFEIFTAHRSVQLIPATTSPSRCSASVATLTAKARKPTLVSQHYPDLPNDVSFPYATPSSGPTSLYRVSRQAAR
jgi:hypothetical protein